MYSEVAVPGLGVLWRSHDRPEATVIPADGCADIILRDDELIVAGPSTRWLLARGGADGSAVGLRFEPGLAGRVLGIDPSELRDIVTTAREALGTRRARRGESALRALLAAGEPAGSAEGRSHPGAGNGVLREATRSSSHPLDLDLDSPTLDWTAEVRAAAARGEPSARLARRLGYSERQLRRRMLQSFGYGYSSLRRILRAERARDALRTGAAPAVAAQIAGYADQSHLTREFRRVVGFTPRQFAAGRVLSAVPGVELSGASGA